jgi:hypothetical protein
MSKSIDERDVITRVGWSFFFGLFGYGLHLPFPEGAIMSTARNIFAFGF